MESTASAPHRKPMVQTTWVTLAHSRESWPSIGRDDGDRVVWLSRYGTNFKDGKKSASLVNIEIIFGRDGHVKHVSYIIGTLSKQTENQYIARFDARKQFIFSRGEHGWKKTIVDMGPAPPEHGPNFVANFASDDDGFNDRNIVVTTPGKNDWYLLHKIVDKNLPQYTFDNQVLMAMHTTFRQWADTIDVLSHRDIQLIYMVNFEGDYTHLPMSVETLSRDLYKYFKRQIERLVENPQPVFGGQAAVAPLQTEYTAFDDEDDEVDDDGEDD